MGQHFTLDDVGRTKGDAMLKLMYKINPNSNMSFYGRLTEDTYQVSRYTFSGFDNMTARKLLFDMWVDSNSYSGGIFIDGRQNAETLEVYAVTSENIDRFRETLFDDSEIEELPCNFKATTHTGFITSALMMSIFTNFITNQVCGDNIRVIPFKTSFNIPLMLMEQEL